MSVSAIYIMDLYTWTVGHFLGGMSDDSECFARNLSQAQSAHECPPFSSPSQWSLGTRVGGEWRRSRYGMGSSARAGCLVSFGKDLSLLIIATTLCFTCRDSILGSTEAIYTNPDRFHKRQTCLGSSPIWPPMMMSNLYFPSLPTRKTSRR